MIGNSLVLSFESKISADEYAEGYRIFNYCRGKYSGMIWKYSLFFIISVAMLVVLIINRNDITLAPGAVIIFAASFLVCMYYLLIQPKIVQEKGKKVYESSAVLDKTCRVDIYRDHFLIKSKNELLKRYYTELSDVIETDDIFLLIGGFEKRSVIISKKSIDPEQNRLLTEHFQRETVRQYKRTRDKA